MEKAKILDITNERFYEQITQPGVLRSEYARDIKTLIIYEDTIRDFIDDYDQDEYGDWVKIWVGFRTSLTGGVDIDFEVTHLRASYIIDNIWRQLEKMALEAEDAYTRHDVDKMKELGMNPETGRGYIAVVLKCICDGEYTEWILNENSQHVTSMIPVDRW